MKNLKILMIANLSVLTLTACGQMPQNASVQAVNDDANKFDSTENLVVSGAQKPENWATLLEKPKSTTLAQSLCQFDQSKLSLNTNYFDELRNFVGTAGEYTYAYAGDYVYADTTAKPSADNLLTSYFSLSSWHVNNNSQDSSENYYYGYDGYGSSYGNNSYDELSAQLPSLDPAMLNRLDIFCKNSGKRQRFNNAINGPGLVGRHLRFNMRYKGRNEALKFRIENVHNTSGNMFEIVFLSMSDGPFKALTGKHAFISLGAYRRTIPNLGQFDYQRIPMVITATDVSAQLRCDMDRAGSISCQGKGLPQLMGGKNNYDDDPAKPGTQMVLRSELIGRSTISVELEVDLANAN